jgi:hypothetical protein
MLSFAQPLFLLALGGLVLPFLIHRISRARPIAWKFPSIHRIRKTPLPRQGKRAISDWLLLLLRALILTLFILALAGPIWTPQSSETSGEHRSIATSVVLVDNSSSMAGWGAIAETREILKELDQQGEVEWNWLLADSSIRSSPAADQGSDGEASIPLLLEYMNEHAPSREIINPRPALIRAVEMLVAAETPGQLHIISDFQESNWGASLPELPESVDVQLHRVGSKGRDRNLGVQEVAVVALENDRLRIIAQVMNYGNQPTRAEVLLENSDRRQTTTVEIDPRLRIPVIFEIDRPTDSPHAVLEIEPAEEDPYPRDDRFAFRASAPDPLEVLAIVVDPVSGKDSEELFFLKQALATDSSSEWDRYSLFDVGLFAITPDGLAETAAVFLPAGAFSDPSLPWEALLDYIRQGGLVVATMGKDAVRGFQALRALDFPIGDYLGTAGRSRSDQFFVGPLPESSPLSTIFDGPSERDLYLMSLHRHVRLRLDESAATLLQSEEEHPLIASVPYEDGSLVLSAFPWDRSASDFPLRPSYLPIVREVFALANVNSAAFSTLEREDPLPSAESVTAVVAPEELLHRLTAANPNPNTDRSDLSSLGAGDQNRTIAFAPWLLLLALLALILESLLARKLISSN